MCLSVCPDLKDHGIAMSVCLVNVYFDAVAERLFKAEDVETLVIIAHLDRFHNLSRGRRG